MQPRAVEEVLQGLKKAGVDFVSLLPDSDFSELQERVGNDLDFTCVPVSNEAIGVGACAGAWLSREGKFMGIGTMLSAKDRKKRRGLWKWKVL